MNLKMCRKLINKMRQNLNGLCVVRDRSINLYEKMFYNSLIQEEMYKINVLKEFLRNMMEMKGEYENSNDLIRQTFTIEELAKYDGKGNNPAYVAIDGIVYDVSFEAVWAAGKHFGLEAGRDLSDEFKSCHKEEVLKKLKKVGVLKK